MSGLESKVKGVSPVAGLKSGQSDRKVPGFRRKKVSGVIKEGSKVQGSAFRVGV